MAKRTYVSSYSRKQNGEKVSVEGHYRSLPGMAQNQNKEINNKESLFFKAKHEYLSKIIEMKNPREARGSVKELRKQFNKAETNAKKLRVARATQLAANRAGAQLKRKNISQREKRQFEEIQDIYQEQADKFFKIV